jgi:hypothetical protein
MVCGSIYAPHAFGQPAGRNPKGTEIRHRGRVNAAVAALMQATIDGNPEDVDAWVETNMADLTEDDRTVLASSIKAVLQVIGASNFDAWEVRRELAEAFASARESIS